MTHALLIALVVTLVIGEEFPFFPLVGAQPAWFVIAGTLVPYAVLAVVVHVVLRMAVHAIDNSGSPRIVLLGERTIIWSRFAACGWHVISVLLLGWAHVIRSWTGPMVLVDEILILCPPLIVMVLGWVSYYPIERRIRDAALIGRLDRGEPVHATPSRRDYVVDQVRHQLFMVLIPIALIVGWQELAAWDVPKFVDSENA